MLDALNGELHSDERALLTPIYEADVGDLDVTLVSPHGNDGFLKCKFASRSGLRCPFVVILGRGSQFGILNTYIGLGAELHNYERWNAPGASDDLSLDLRLFLRSSIRCVRHIARGVVVRAEYYLSGFLVDGKPLCLYFRKPGWPVFRYRTDSVTLASWLTDSQSPSGGDAP